MTTLAELQNKKNAIQHSTDLSTAGKEKALAVLQKEADNFRASSVRDLGGQWATLKGKMKNNIEAVKSAEAAAAAKWDYSRLNYMAQAVKSQIAGAATLEDIQRIYNQAMQSGDTHAQRVWGEMTHQNITSKYNTGDAEAFAKQVQRDLDKILTTPELNTLRVEGSELTRQAADLYAQTQQTNQYFSGSASMNALYGTKTEFDKLMEGVRIDQKVSPQTLAVITTVTLPD